MCLKFPLCSKFFLGGGLGFRDRLSIEEFCLLAYIEEAGLCHPETSSLGHFGVHPPVATGFTHILVLVAFGAVLDAGRTI